MVTPDVWVPTGMYDSMAFEARTAGEPARLGAPGFRALILVARLPESATIASLAPRLDVVTRQMAAADPAANADYEIQLAPLSRVSVSTRPQADDELTTFFGLLLSLAAVVLLIASFNLANMLLARGRARSREFAIRVAIGGSHWRLVRQLLIESFVLAFLGGIGGLALSSWALRFLFVNVPAVMPVSLAFDPTPDIRVLASTLVFAVLSAMVFGLGPAWRFARTDVLPELKEQAGEVPTRRLWLRWLTTRDALVMGQLALTFVMLTAAGLFVRGAIEAAESDPGFTLDRGIMANTDTTLIDLSPGQRDEFYRGAMAGLRRLPGVEVAALASHMPFGEFEDSVNVQLPGAPLRSGDPGAQEHLFSATTASIGAHYFATMGVPVLRGRELSEAEEFASGSDAIAIIDDTLARRLFPDADPIGQSVQVAGNRESDPPTLLRIVGVVGGVRPNLFDEGPRAFIYRPYGQEPRDVMYLHARTSAPTAAAETAMLPTVRRLLADLAPNPPVVSLETRPMFRERNLLLAVVRTGATLFAVLGMAALTLAAVGIYGVKSYLVSRRTREIGVRVALGAEPRDVVWMVIREGLVLIGVGVVAGAGLSLLTGQALRAVLFQGRALDVPVVVITTVTLVASVLLASWLPARRATRVAPATALRSRVVPATRAASTEAGSVPTGISRHSHPSLRRWTACSGCSCVSDPVQGEHRCSRARRYRRRPAPPCGPRPRAARDSHRISSPGPSTRAARRGESVGPPHSARESTPSSCGRGVPVNTRPFRQPGASISTESFGIGFSDCWAARRPRITSARVDMTSDPVFPLDDLPLKPLQSPSHERNRCRRQRRAP